MFLCAVQILLQNIRAERNGLRLLHWQMIAAVLRCFLITNLTNYARWTPAYICDMLNLSETVKYVFMSGQISIRHKHGVLNSIWSDMAAEKTSIKDSKYIIGLTRKKPALFNGCL